MALREFNFYVSVINFADVIVYQNKGGRHEGSAQVCTVLISMHTLLPPLLTAERRTEERERGEMMLMCMSFYFY